MTTEPTGSTQDAGPAASPEGRHDLVAGLLTAALGVAVVLYVRTFPELPDGQPGPALVPGIIGGLLVVFGLVLAVRAVGAIRRGERPGVDAPATTHGRLRALGVVGFVVGYLLLAETLGFLVTTAVLLFLLMWLLGSRPLVAGCAAAATTGFIFLVFGQLLLVPLPSGPLG